MLSFGQFSLIDFLAELLEQTGPARVDIATWTSSAAHSNHLRELLDAGSITRLRLFFDYSFRTRHPDSFAALVGAVGIERVRELRSHAKWVTISAGDWRLVIQTSMNLNENPRLETLGVSDSPDLCAFLENVFDSIFDDRGVALGSRFPSLDGIDDLAASGLVHMGTLAARKQLSLGR